ncbi:protein NO VEIN domain-containing protein [Clostridium thermobutyricum]|uniref:protein NO VEIN domain-containing protein n=1 Tax=Clostridium thermobutyricum TaxID=29372 RepID=UPI003F525400
MNYIGPGIKSNIQKSILQNVNSKVEKYTNYVIKGNQQLYAWAISNKNRWKSYNPSDGEYIGIYQSGNEDTILYIGKIIFSVNSLELTKAIWGGEAKEKVIIFEKKDEIKTTRTDIWKKFNYGKKLQSLKSTDVDISKIKRNEIENFDSSKIDSSYKDLTNELLNKIKDIKINNNFRISIGSKKNRQRRNNDKLHKKKCVNSGEIDVNYPKNLVGLYGENIVYKYLCSLKLGNIKSEKLLKGLNFENKEYIKDIIFYNENVEIKDGIFKDMSVGRGHDIKVITNYREIKLEVKSSKDKISMFHMSHNELLEMKIGGKNNFIITVDQVLKSPNISIIKNFSELYTSESIDMILKISIEISKIPSDYLV